MLDPVWLRSFLAVVDTGGFARAARSLGIGQATVSQHVRKLESAAGRQLLVRDTRTVELSGDGEAMVGFARGILGHQQRALDYFAEPQPSGRVRVGVSEDLVQGRHFSEITRRFQRLYPRVDLDLTAGLSAPLHERFTRGELDLALIKQPVDDVAGRVLWRDDLVWVGAPATRLPPDEPLPLVTYPEPSITRSRALAALGRADRSWRIACTSDRLSGLRVAVQAGLGVAVFAHGVVPDGLVPLAEQRPALGDVGFVLTCRGSVRGTPSAALARVITTCTAGDRAPRSQ